MLYSILYIARNIACHTACYIAYYMLPSDFSPESDDLASQKDNIKPWGAFPCKAQTPTE